MDYREINEKYINVPDEHHKVVCIKSLTGTGKTQMAIKYIQ
jgi:hypothetical protein